MLHVEGPGRPVGELPLFDGGPYPASAATTEESRLIFLPRAEFEALYRANPDVAQAIIGSLGTRLRYLVHVAETLAFRDVASRLALLLAGYADGNGRQTEGASSLRSTEPRRSWRSRSGRHGRRYRARSSSSNAEGSSRRSAATGS